MRKKIYDGIIFGVAAVDAVNTIIQWFLKIESFGWSREIWLGIGIGIFFIAVLALMGGYLFWKKNEKEEEQSSGSQEKSKTSKLELPVVVQNSSNATVDATRLEYNYRKVSEQLQNCLEDAGILKRQNEVLGKQVNQFMAIQDNDRKHLKDLLIVSNERLSGHYLERTMGGRLEFSFDIFNASILGIDIGHSMNGHIYAQSIPFYDETEPLNSPTNIQHGELATLTINQKVLPEVVKKIYDFADNNKDGFILKLDFSNLHISYMEDTNSKGMGWDSIVLPKGMKYCIKSDGHGFYDWDRIWENVK